MNTHAESHPQAGQTVTLNPKSDDASVVAGAVYRIEDWWDYATGGSWMDAEGNPAALKYAMRAGMSGGEIPMDNEVVYGKIGPFGHIVHVSELGQVV